MRTIEKLGSRLIVKNDPPAKTRTVDERLVALEAENTAMKSRLTKLEKANNPA